MSNKQAEQKEKVERENEKSVLKLWPIDCIWPEPIENAFDIPLDEMDYDVDHRHRKADPFIDELVQIKEFADRLVDDEILNDEYELVDDEVDLDELAEKEDLPLEWDRYFQDENFDYDFWRDSFADRYYKLKLYEGPVEEIESIIDYDFVNENLLRQAFTRKSFANEHINCKGGSYEELEFIGDRVLDLIVTKEIARQFMEINNEETIAPFESKYSAGQFSEMKVNLVCKDHLARRAEQLGLDKYILYGTGDSESDNAKEDVIEAIIGAAAMDCNWNMDILENVVDHLINLQLDIHDLVLRKNFYDIFNSWHKRRFGELPEYFTYKNKKGSYTCSLQFQVPVNDKNIPTMQHIETTEMTRSQARSRAAEKAEAMLQQNGLWRELKNSGIVPDFNNCINQWQELYQKKYISEPPVYELKERTGISGKPDDSWFCQCTCENVMGFGIAGSKVQAKKRAAFMAMKNLYAGAGISKPEWDELIKEHLNDIAYISTRCIKLK